MKDVGKFRCGGCGTTYEGPSYRRIRLQLVVKDLETGQWEEEWRAGFVCERCWPGVARMAKALTSGPSPSVCDAKPEKEAGGGDAPDDARDAEGAEPSPGNPLSKIACLCKAANQWKRLASWAEGESLDVFLLARAAQKVCEKHLRKSVMELRE